MQLTINWPDKGKVPNRKFLEFTQKMAYRIIQGNFRYGLPNAEAKYLDRLKKEVREYSRTGNAEHLYNAANYCQLEAEAPQNKRFHYDSTVGSATRR